MKHNEIEQQRHWDNVFTEEPDLYGTEPSAPAHSAEEVFANESVSRIIELGGGQGRDTLYFAQNGFQVYTLDYSNTAVMTIINKAQSHNLSRFITAIQHDVRYSLPFKDGAFDGCYSHMLYCMALNISELEFLSREIWRVLRPNGLHIYTVRSTKDAHYQTGIHRGEEMYEVGGFVVHFFNQKKVEHLAKGFEIIGIDEFEEGALPRKLFRVTLRKRQAS